MKLFRLSFLLSMFSLLFFNYCFSEESIIDENNLIFILNETKTSHEVSADDLIVVANVNIYNTKIINQSGNEIIIGFDITNEDTFIQPGIKYAVQLLSPLKENKERNFTVDENVYEEVLTLDPGETVYREISYTPPSVFDGEYQIAIFSSNEKGLPLSMNMVGDVKLKKQDNNILIDNQSCYLKIEGEPTRYTLLQGVDISEDEVLKLFCDINNQLNKNILVTPKLKSYERTSFGSESIMKSFSQRNIVSGNNKLSFIISGNKKPQSYAGEFAFYIKDKLVSNKILTHYVVRGNSATIQNVRLDKNFYEIGDLAKISLDFSGRADYFMGSRINGNDPTGLKSSPVFFDIIIKNKNDEFCTESFVTDSSKANLIGLIELEIPITKKCENPKIFVKAQDKNNKTLDKTGFTVKTYIESSEKNKKQKTKNRWLFMAILFSSLILIFMFLFKNRFGLKMFLVLIGSFSIFNAVEATTVVVPPPAPWAALAFGVHTTVGFNKSVYKSCTDSTAIIAGRMRVRNCRNATVTGQFYVNGSLVASKHCGKGMDPNRDCARANFAKRINISRIPGKHCIGLLGKYNLRESRWNQQKSGRICYRVEACAPPAEIPKVEITKISDHTPNSEVLPNENIRYTITARNTGKLPLTNVVATDTLVSELEFVTGQTSNVTSNGQSVTLNFGNLAIGATKTFWFDGRVRSTANANTQFCNVAHGRGNSSNGNVSDNSNQVCHKVGILPIPSININKIDANQTDLDGNTGNDTQTISEGGTAVFEITVTNDGTENLNTVVISDTESPSCSKTAEQTLELYEGNIFDVGESFTYICEIENVTTNTFADGDNDIEVSGVGVDSGTIVNDEDPTMIIISRPSINIDKIDANQIDLDGSIGNDTQTISEGGTAVFEITVTNDGTENLNTVVISDTESPNCSKTAEQTLALYEGTIFDVGESFTYTCEIENVTTNTFADGDNDIEVIGVGVDSGTIVNDEDPTIIRVTRPSINIDKVDANDEDQDENIGNDTQTISDSGTAIFGITVTNDGTENLNTVVISDTESPSCSKTAEQTLELYEGNTFDVGESFTYTCEIENVTSTTFVDGYNDIEVTGIGIDSGTIVNDEDPTEVIINPVRPGSFCGDGTVDTPNSNGENEQCDDGNDVDNDECSNTCQENNQFCGNGIIENPEQCDDGNDIDNDNCSNTCTNNSGGGGGGGPSAVPTIGTCTMHSQTGAWQCIARKPYEHGPQWAEYQDCVEGNSAGFTVDETTPGITRAQKCSYAWGISQGFQTCGDTIGTNTDYFSLNNPETNICNPLPPLDPGTPNVEKFDTTCAACFKTNAFISKTADKSYISKGDKVEYTIKLELGSYDNTNYDILTADVKVFDYTIPADGGNLWGRNGILGGDWTSASAGGATKSFSIDPSNLNHRGGETIELKYTMNSALAADTDTASIDNVAFAVIDYTYRQKVCEEPCTLDTGRKAFIISNKDKSGVVFEKLRKKQHIEMASFSSLGDMVSVKIIRPFVKANNGGNLGFELEKGRTEKVTGTEKSKTDGTVFVEDNENVSEDLFNFDGYTAIDNIDPLKSFQTEDIDKYYDNLRFNTIEIKSNGEVFEKTPIQEVYFYDGAELSFEGELNLNGKNKTYIIENGDLVIGKEGLKLKNGFAAFIVRNGDIIIHEDAKEIEGIFISEKGEIKSNAISKKQLKVSGALMGDLASLLNDRWYIGENPDIELEPNVEIEFDLRLLEDTLPALEQFIGSDWQESVE